MKKSCSNSNTLSLNFQNGLTIEISNDVLEECLEQMVVPMSLGFRESGDCA